MFSSPPSRSCPGKKIKMTVDKNPAIYHPQHHHWYHRNAHVFKRLARVGVAGTGFLADAYDLFVINVALLMMKQNQDRYFVKLTPDIQGQVSMMAIVGAMCGQMIFGVIGDQFGRRNTFITTAVLVIVGTVAQACIQPVDGYFNIWRQMMFFRFIMGVGIGGEYPLSSSITSETSDEGHRGRNLACVFSMQGFGRVLCAAVLLFSAFFITNTEWQWRFSILMGAVPMMVSIYFRGFPETEVYVRDVQSRTTSATERAKAIVSVVWENRVKLAGTAGSWFILDVLFYGNSLFSSDITRAMGIENTIKGKALQNLYIQLIALPGYIFGIFFMDIVGRKRLQLFGFAGEAIIFAIMAIFLAKIKLFNGLFICLYALTFFFDDFGPNLTTFVIPATIYPTEVRSTCHGISAAFGKAGAALSARLFLKLKDTYCPHDFCDKHAPQHLVDKGLRLTFLVCCLLAVLGFFWTLLLVTDKTDKSLQDAESVYDIESEKEHEAEMKIELAKRLENGTITAKAVH